MSRFDFGVPLEDIFPPNDIHPRLKYLFEEAYTLYATSKIDIERIVKQFQGPLEARLNLKQRIINDPHYDIKTEKIEQAPGAYFWLIRHFLGLLPIPLLPTYSQGICYKWTKLSKKCKHFLRNYESEHDRKYELDHEFAEELNLLPFEHFLLLTILINFIRKLSKKHVNGGQINRRSLQFLSKYYYASICIRPYMPGYKDDEFFPMFFYIVLRWHEIEKRCRIIGHPTYFLESNCMNYETHDSFGIRDNRAQTHFFSPKVIRIYKNVPYFCNNNNYLKDIGCQTELADVVDRATQNSEIKTEEAKTKCRHEGIPDEETSLFHRPLPSASSPINNNECVVQEKFCDDTEFSFVSTDNSVNKMGWCEIQKETAGTVKKVEEYIYDDYDTFSKEAYNQISDENKNRGSLLNQVSKIGWTYTPENSARDQSPDKNEMNNTYVKFEDVFDENGKYKTNGNEVKENTLNVTFKKCNDSKTPLCNYSVQPTNGTEIIEEGRSRKNFKLKRFKLKLDFLRVLTPKRVAGSIPSYDSIESKVKYKKIKNIKSNTL